MSVLPLKADIAEGDWHVRFVPKGDISNRSRSNTRLQLRSHVLGDSHNELGARRIAEDLQVPL
jgi:hypothetical protein